MKLNKTAIDAEIDKENIKVSLDNLVFGSLIFLAPTIKDKLHKVSNGYFG